MKTKLLALLTLPFLLITTSTSYACDDKPCESAYLASTQQYISNSERHAKTLRIERKEYIANLERQFEALLKERRAHARNRERRDFALYHHIHSTTSTNMKKVSHIIKAKKIRQNSKLTIS